VRSLRLFAYNLSSRDCLPNMPLSVVGDMDKQAGNSCRKRFLPDGTRFKQQAGSETSNPFHCSR
jgi:hypothetical protein